MVVQSSSKKSQKYSEKCVLCSDVRLCGVRPILIGFGRGLVLQLAGAWGSSVE